MILDDSGKVCTQTHLLVPERHKAKPPGTPSLLIPHNSCITITKRETISTYYNSVIQGVGVGGTIGGENRNKKKENKKFETGVQIAPWVEEETRERLTNS